MSDEPNGESKEMELPGEKGKLIAVMDSEGHISFSVEGRLTIDDLMLMLAKVKVHIDAQAITDIQDRVVMAKMRENAGKIQEARPGQRFPGPKGCP